MIFTESDINEAIDNMYYGIIPLHYLLDVKKYSHPTFKELMMQTEEGKKFHSTKRTFLKMLRCREGFSNEIKENILKNIENHTIFKIKQSINSILEATTSIKEQRSERASSCTLRVSRDHPRRSIDEIDRGAVDGFFLSSRVNDEPPVDEKLFDHMEKLFTITQAIIRSVEDTIKVAGNPKLVAELARCSVSEGGSGAESPSTSELNPAVEETTKLQEEMIKLKENSRLYVCSLEAMLKELESIPRWLESDISIRVADIDHEHKKLNKEVDRLLALSESEDWESQLSEISAYLMRVDIVSSIDENRHHLGTSSEIDSFKFTANQVVTRGLVPCDEMLRDYLINHPDVMHFVLYHPSYSDTAEKLMQEFSHCIARQGTKMSDVFRTLCPDSTFTRDLEDRYDVGSQPVHASTFFTPPTSPKTNDVERESLRKGPKVISGDPHANDESIDMPTVISKCAG